MEYILCKQIKLQLSIINTNNLYTFIWFQVFLCNNLPMIRIICKQLLLKVTLYTNNIYMVLWFQITIPI